MAPGKIHQLVLVQVVSRISGSRQHSPAPGRSARYLIVLRAEIRGHGRRQPGCCWYSCYFAEEVQGVADDRSVTRCKAIGQNLDGAVRGSIVAGQAQREGGERESFRVKLPQNGKQLRSADHAQASQRPC